MLELWQKISNSISQRTTSFEGNARSGREDRANPASYLNTTELTAKDYLAVLKEEYPKGDQRLYLDTLSTLLMHHTYVEFFKHTMYDPDFFPTITIEDMSIFVPLPETPDFTLHFERDKSNSLISDLNVLNFYASGRLSNIYTHAYPNTRQKSTYGSLFCLREGVEMLLNKGAGSADLYSDVSQSTFVNAVARIYLGCTGMDINLKAVCALEASWQQTIFNSPL